MLATADGSVPYCPTCIRCVTTTAGLRTKHAAVAEGAGNLDKLVHVLRAYKPARDLLTERLRAAKIFTAELYSGAHRLGKITVEEYHALIEPSAALLDLWLCSLILISLSGRARRS